MLPQKFSAATTCSPLPPEVAPLESPAPAAARARADSSTAIESLRMDAQLYANDTHSRSLLCREALSLASWTNRPAGPRRRLRRCAREDIGTVARGVR